jgi:Family of unknown function (DUF6317)
MSAAGFQVFLSDLQKASGVFHTESGTFGAIMPDNGPACPDGGSADIDQAMQAAMKLLGLLHAQMASVIQAHSVKLQDAHDNYERVDGGMAQYIALTYGV